MVITNEGLSFIKITHGDTTVAINPVSKKSKFAKKASSFGADVCLITTNHPDTNGEESVTRGDKKPFVARGPGEYEVNNLFIEGFDSKTTYDDQEKHNTIYTFGIDNIKVAHFGLFGDEDLSNKAKEDMGDVDVLFIPIGGNGALEAQEAYKLAVKREPKIIIPVYYDKESLKLFLKEAGAENVKPVDKITLKQKDLSGKQGEVVVLKSSF